MKAPELKSEIGKMTKTPAGWDGGRKAKTTCKEDCPRFQFILLPETNCSLAVCIFFRLALRCSS
jgi:hypothetical protein